MDGVIADFMRGACALHGVPYPYDNLHYKGDSRSIEQIYGISKARFFGNMKRDFWLALEPTREAKDIVGLLEDKFGIQNLSILSSPISTNTGECVQGKVDWLKKHFPQFNRRFLFGPVKEMAACCGTLLIDDHEPNIDRFAANGGHVFLVPRPWNRAFMDEYFVVEELREYLEGF
jgi:5'(3')-deoxyribonucleotidase